MELIKSAKWSFCEHHPEGLKDVECAECLARQGTIEGYNTTAVVKHLDGSHVTFVIEPEDELKKDVVR